ncbi:hypothetical protein BBOV_II001690 [Babesia bovis T2Bo]|uniref:Uncharacterized protein n=1 Tax=Babesia bovis TaxID=5865 RepID=A7AT65_BABBO|nr:hypothetical protein BBOV_II001690 [Babesia bovis T2Bo]EDO06126.1 hypothetical protein BBOV_II001690 [Babesia bovis T2Bo]|eukprot:XP_001609694.1 hypothetical protein [Babesia bovis T2Bo]
MDSADRVKYCRERLRALRLALPRIAKSLNESREQLEGQRGKKMSSLSSVSQIRLTLLDDYIESLKQAKSKLSPTLEGAMELLERIDSLSSSLALTRQRLTNVQRITTHSEMQHLSERISLTEKRLIALDRLMKHLSPSMPNIGNEDAQAESHMIPSTVEAMEQLLDTADSLMESKAFCDSLQELEYLKGSTVLIEAIHRLGSSLDFICEVSFLWIQRESRLLSMSLCAVFNDASVIALRHSNAFVPSTTGSEKLPDNTELRKVIDQAPESSNGISVALRVLKLLKMRPTYLYHFLSGMRDILGQVSLKRFSAYSNAVKVDIYKRGVALSSLLKHLRSNVRFMKQCVINLYNNAGIPLHDPDLRWHGIIFPTAEMYLRHILKWLTIPLENKLYQLMQDNVISPVDGIINCGPVVDIFYAIETVKYHIDQLEAEFQTPWSVCKSPSGIHIDGLELEQTSPDSDVYHPEIESKSQHSDISENINIATSKNDLATGEVIGSTEFEIDCATQRTEEEGDINHEDHAAGMTMDSPSGEDPLIAKLQRVHAEWKKQMLEDFKLRIEDPLSTGSIYLLEPASDIDISSSHVTHTVADFIADIIKVQSTHDPSDGFRELLRKTLDAIIACCKMTSQKYGDRSSAYLLNCYAVLMQSLSSNVVPQEIVDILVNEISSNIDAAVQQIWDELCIHMGLEQSNEDLNTRKDVLARISEMVFSDGLVAADTNLTKCLKLVASNCQMEIRSRIYHMLADKYAAMASNEYESEAQELQEFVAQL